MRRSASNVTGVFPIVHLKIVLSRSFLGFLPYFNYGGICAETPEGLSKIIGRGDSPGGARDGSASGIKGDPRMNHGQMVKNAKASMPLSLPSSSDELCSFSSKAAKSDQQTEKGRDGCQDQRGRGDRGFLQSFVNQYEGFGNASLFKNILLGYS